jgi:hypothetical protein
MAGIVRILVCCVRRFQTEPGDRRSEIELPQFLWRHGTVSLSHISLPDAAEDVVAVLSAEGLDFPRNVLDLKAKQNWGDVGSAESFTGPKATNPFKSSRRARLALAAGKGERERGREGWKFCG